MSRGRRIIENTFGILAGRWRVLWSKIDCSKETASRIICATVVLHNFLNQHPNNDNNNVEITYPSNYVDQYDDNGDFIFGDWRQNCAQDFVNDRETANEAPRDIKTLRDVLSAYFVMPAGQVPWQNEILNRTS